MGAALNFLHYIYLKLSKVKKVLQVAALMSKKTDGQTDSQQFM